MYKNFQRITVIILHLEYNMNKRKYSSADALYVYKK